MYDDECDDPPCDDLQFIINNNDDDYCDYDYDYDFDYTNDDNYPFITMDMIGAGGSSAVFDGIIKKTNQKVAIKIISRYTYDLKSRHIFLFKEINILKKLNHRGIPKFYGIYCDRDNYYLLEESINGFELFELLSKAHNGDIMIPPDLKMYYVREIVNVIKYLHNNDIVHRDIKPENIIIEKDTNRVVIIDFGLSINIKKNELGKEYMCKLLCGTAGYIAPELYKLDKAYKKTKKEYKGKPIDIWSLGICIYNIFTDNIMPFKGKDEDDLHIDIEKYLMTSEIDYTNIPDVISNILKKIFILDYNKRITIDEIYQLIM